MTPAAPRATGWSVGHVVALAAVFLLGIVIRVVLWPTQGLRGDVDQFVVWVHGIAINGLPNAYDQNLTFGPVMSYVWGALAAIEPGFRTAVDASDPVIRSLMKVPASIADIALAGLVVYALRQRPMWAVIAAVAILLHPAVFYVSAWWGQYESIYLLSALAAVLAATRGHNGWAAAFLAASLMTKPQAIPFLIPFIAWFWATGYRREGAHGGIRGGLLELVTTGFIGLGVVVVLWLPFVPAGGPLHYLDNLRQYQGDIFDYLSLRAWNVWWLVQSLFAQGGFVRDDVPLAGPVTLRVIGLGLTVLLEIVVAGAVIRDPRPRTLILALAASTLVVFTFMTTMHERYAYGALIFLVLLVPEAGPRWLWLAFGAVFTLNLLAAAPPSPEIGDAITSGGLLGVVGAIAMLVITLTAVLWLDRSAGPSGDGKAAGRAIASPA
jgi:Gpi18-like mannosyltransferase